MSPAIRDGFFGGGRNVTRRPKNPTDPLAVDVSSANLHITIHLLGIRQQFTLMIGWADMPITASRVDSLAHPLHFLGLPGDEPPSSHLPHSRSWAPQLLLWGFLSHSTSGKRSGPWALHTEDVSPSLKGGLIGVTHRFGFSDPFCHASQQQQLWPSIPCASADIQKHVVCHGSKAPMQ